MTIALGTDHAGFAAEDAVKTHLATRGHAILDLGAFNDEPSDYPVHVIPAAEAVAGGTADCGVVFGGSGNGEAIAANKVRGIRCAVCWNPDIGRLARRHNDANVISLPARRITPGEACAIVDAWLATDYEGGRHDARLALISRYERAAL